MLERLKARVGDSETQLTPLTARLLMAEMDGRGAAAPQTDRRLTTEETIARKNHLIENWPMLTSDDILRTLDMLLSAALADVPQLDLAEEAELWLLRALALEKAFAVRISDIEAVYHECRHLGRFHSILVRNNLAVIYVRKQWCLQALDSLKLAVRESIAYHMHLRAPFYNCALVLQFLHNTRLIFNSSYLAVLGELQQLLPYAAREAVPEEVMNVQPPPHRGSWTSEQIESVCEQLARYAHDTAESDAPEMIKGAAGFIVPEFDFFASFGDVPDQYNRRGGYAMLDQAMRLCAEDQFARALGVLDIVPHFNPDLRTESEEKKRQACDQWRSKSDTEMIDHMAKGDYEAAVRTITDLPGMLKRPGDAAVASTLRSQELLAAAREADDLLQNEDKEGARPRYVWLLMQPDLDPELRRSVSAKLESLLD